MANREISVNLAISLTSRWPYYSARVLGLRAGSQPGELVVPLQLQIDEALLRRRTAVVRIDIPTPETPTATVARS